MPSFHRFWTRANRAIRACVPRRLLAESYVSYAVVLTVGLIVAAAVLAFGQLLVSKFGQLGTNLMSFGG